MNQPLTATPVTIAQQLATARVALQQATIDYPTVQLTPLERQRISEDLVAIRAVLNSLANVASGGGK